LSSGKYPSSEGETVKGVEMTCSRKEPETKLINGLGRKKVWSEKQGFQDKGGGGKKAVWRDATGKGYFPEALN